MKIFNMNSLNFTILILLIVILNTIKGISTNDNIQDRKTKIDKEPTSGSNNKESFCLNFGLITIQNLMECEKIYDYLRLKNQFSLIRSCLTDRDWGCTVIEVKKSLNIESDKIKNNQYLYLRQLDCESKVMNYGQQCENQCQSKLTCYSKCGIEVNNQLIKCYQSFFNWSPDMIEKNLNCYKSCKNIKELKVFFECSYQCDSPLIDSLLKVEEVIPTIIEDNSDSNQSKTFTKDLDSIQLNSNANINYYSLIFNMIITFIWFKLELIN